MESAALSSAFALPENAGKGVIQLNGRMVERLHAELAERTLAIARRITAFAGAETVRLEAAREGMNAGAQNEFGKPSRMSQDHHALFQLGPDATPYRKLTSDGVRVEQAMGREILVVEAEAIRALSEQR